MDCIECFRLLCKILTGSGNQKSDYQTQLTRHQVEIHHRTEAALFPGKLVHTDAPKVKDWKR